MENLSEPNPGKGILEFNSEAISHLKETRKWTMFLSVIGFIFIGLLFLGSIALISAGGLTGTPVSAPTAIPLIAMCAIYFFPVYFLYQFSRKAKQAVCHSDGISLSKALQYLKMHYLFMGILVIIAIAIYLIMIPVMISTFKMIDVINTPL